MSDDMIFQAVLAVAAALLTLLTAWLNAKKKEAYEQGDMILASFGKVTEIAAGLAVVFPTIKPEADALKVIQEKLAKGWEDKAFTTEQMQAIYDEGMLLFKSVMEKVTELRG